MRSGCRAAWRLLRVVLHLIQGLLTLRFRFPRWGLIERRAAVQAWSHGLLRVLGIELRVSGPLPEPGRPVLLIANHVSWLDIAAVHSVFPQARFVAKADVHHWPLVGWLCSAAGTLFIERERKRDALRVVHEMASALRSGDTVAIFPEGTTSDGHSLRPFHANLFQAAISTATPVFPVALRFSDPQHAISPLAEYTGDTSLLQSLWRLLPAQGLVVSVKCCGLVAAATEDRRALAHQCQEVIEARLALF